MTPEQNALLRDINRRMRASGDSEHPGDATRALMTVIDGEEMGLRSAMRGEGAAFAAAVRRALATARVAVVDRLRQLAEAPPAPPDA